jgi:hypothetical protein
MTIVGALPWGSSAHHNSKNPVNDPVRRSFFVGEEGSRANQICVQVRQETASRREVRGEESPVSAVRRSYYRSTG